MNIRHALYLIPAAAVLLLAATACTQDELTDDTRLPEGQYPLEIAAVTLSVEGGEAQPWGAPQTRVSETEDGMGSKWDGDEEIDVQIEGSTETATYIVQANGTVSSDAPLYWSDRNTHTVTAWYSATDGTLDLSDQTNGLAYLLHGTGTGNYKNPVELIFTHSLAKVRVTPSKDIGDGEVTSLQLYTYTTCTHTQGKINTEDAQKGWIKMKKCEYNGVTCWEANVVPGYEITKLMANNDNKERDLSAAITPEAGSYYNITLNKDKGYTDDGQGNYTVTSAEGLKNIAKLVNEEGQTDIDITLTGNIILTRDWTPIGTSISNAYTGTFDGGNHTITGLTVTTSDRYAGLFGYIGSGGKVKDVTLENVQITNDNSSGNAGGVAGWSYGNIENCSVSGRVSGSGNNGTAGGVVGYQYGGSLTGCSSSATVNAGGVAGGIAGSTNSGATLTACYATGDVTLVSNDIGTCYAGGVVGSNGSSSTLKACYAWGSVTGSKSSGTVYVGGVTGSNVLGTLTACYHAKGTVSGPGGATGGVAGRNFKDSMFGGGIITACYWGGNGQEQGIGEDQVGTGGTTQVTDGNWTEAMKAMNTALSGTGWLYVPGSGDAPLTLRKQ